MSLILNPAIIAVLVTLLIEYLINLRALRKKQRLSARVLFLDMNRTINKITSYTSYMDKEKTIFRYTGSLSSVSHNLISHLMNITSAFNKNQLSQDEIDSILDFYMSLDNIEEARKESYKDNSNLGPTIGLIKSLNERCLKDKSISNTIKKLEKISKPN